MKPDPVTAVACGRHHTLVALESGTVMAMGSNSEGQLGCGRNPEYTTEPIQVLGSLQQLPSPMKLWVMILFLMSYEHETHE